MPEPVAGGLECADRAGPAIDLFLDRAVPKDADTDQLLVQLALGQLNPAQEAFLLDHPLSSFLCKRSVVGELICSSPVIAQRILNKGPSIWSKYQNCLSALEAEDYAGAATLAASMADKHPRLAAFRELVMLRGAMTAVPARGLFGIDWRSAAEAMQRIQALDQTPIMRFRPWLAVVEASLQIVLGASRNRRLQADRQLGIRRTDGNRAIGSRESASQCARSDIADARRRFLFSRFLLPAESPPGCGLRRILWEQGALHLASQWSEINACLPARCRASATRGSEGSRSFNSRRSDHHPTASSKAR